MALSFSMHLRRAISRSLRQHLIIRPNNQTRLQQVGLGGVSDSTFVAKRFCSSHHIHPRDYSKPYVPTDYSKPLYIEQDDGTYKCFPDDCRVGGAVPISYSKKYLSDHPVLKHCATDALSEYTRQTGDTYELVDIERGNYIGVSGFRYYITFNATSTQKGTTTFEAQVHWNSVTKVSKVTSVRIKTTPNNWCDGWYLVPTEEQIDNGWVQASFV